MKIMIWPISSQIIGGLYRATARTPMRKKISMQSRDNGARMILYGLSPSVREVLELSRLQKIFEIYDSEEQALTS